MKSKFLQGLKHLTFIVWLLIILLPFLTIVIGSFKPELEFYSSSPYVWTKEFTWQNYVQAFEKGDLVASLLTTTIIIILSIVITTIMSSLVAYVLERFEFKYKALLTTLFIVVSFLPMAVMQVSVFRVMNGLKIYDTFIGIALLYSVSDIVVIYLFREHIRKLPQAIDNSALIAGASYWQIYWQIILPSLREAIMVVSMYKVITIYNDFYIQSLYLVSHQTISTYLYQFTSPYKMLWPQICATIIILLIPAIIFLIAIQYNNKNMIFKRSKHD